MEGTLAADAASLRDTLRWAGLQPLPGGGFGRFALKAQTNVVGGTIALSDVNVELDGNVGEGVLTFATDGRQTLQGTLAADGLDLTPYVSTVRLLTGSERDWNRRADRARRAHRPSMSTCGCRRRASRSAMPSSGAPPSPPICAAATSPWRSANRRPSAASSRARSASPSRDAGADFKAQLQFTDVDLDQCLGELFGIRRLEGKGNLGVRRSTAPATASAS